MLLKKYYMVQQELDNLLYNKNILTKPNNVTKLPL